MNLDIKMQIITAEKRKTLHQNIGLVQRNAIQKGLNVSLLKKVYFNNFEESGSIRPNIIKVAIAVVAISALCVQLTSHFVSLRCLLPNNFLVWEVSRPLANCSYCANLTKPMLLWNVTRNDFEIYFYSSQPMIIKNAIKHWRATKTFSFQMFKQLYDQTAGSYDVFDEGCQFLNFETDLFTLKEVFSMPDARAFNEPDQKPWYVGWGICHPDILQTLRQYYDIPDFFPEDAEYPATDNIFFGYEIGAVMHLDYISRLMWQGQVKGDKYWSIAPVTECEDVCNKFDFYVEEGDIVLLDTRVWYHTTRIPKGELSITVQSEYG